MDQRGQASSKDDAPELPPLPVERGAVVAERDRLQSGEPVAAAGTAEENRQMVADQLAAAAGEDGRAAGEARPLLLASLGREPSDPAALRRHALADGVAARPDGVGQPQAGRLQRPGMLLG